MPKTSDAECFSECLDALNNILDLHDRPPVTGSTALADELRAHIRGETVLRNHSSVKAVAAEVKRIADRETMMRERFDIHGLATTKRGLHVYVIGFDKHGFAVCEAFSRNRDNTGYLFTDRPFTMPVQTSLSACTVHLEIRPADRLTAHHELLRLIDSRAQVYRNDLKLKA